MKKTGKSTVRIPALLVLALCTAVCVLAGCKSSIREVPAEEVYSYINPDETKAQTDQGFVIDGVLDEAAYQNNNWLYLHNDDGGNNVDIAMTSYYGEKGMYFVYDVTETVPIYVNLQRASYMNSCIEMYFAPSSVTSLRENSYFEVDMLPTGDMVFKKSNGKGGYVNAATTDDIMAHLGATTKGGEVNTPECYGYCLELFIPWEYMDWLGLDAEAIKNSFVYVDPAHITSNNLTGTNTSTDRYWYFYAQQQGAGFGDVYQYFRFDGSGVLGTVPVTLTGDAHCTLTGDKNVIPGVETTVTVRPEDGYALRSILVDGEEKIREVSFKEDGSVELVVRSGTEGLTVAATAEAVTQGNKTLSGTVQLRKPGGDSLEGVLVTYTGPQGEKPVELDSQGNFELKDLPQGYYILTVEKEGYNKLSRGIFLNRDISTQLKVEYDTFFVEKGTSWVLDAQNDGILRKFGGSGYLMSTDSYHKFTFTSCFRYDETLAEEADTDYFQQQRSGMRILFSNGKYWHIDLLKEGDQYIVQYAKHSGDGSVFSWKGICIMNEQQIAQYTSEEGIRLSVMRDGQYAAIWLGDELLRVEKLEDEYASCTAQLGFEAWIANRDIMQLPYSITGSVSEDLSAAAFTAAEGTWQIAGLFDGYITSPASTGDTGWMWTNDDIYRDVSLSVTDRTPAANDFKLAVHFKFSNGEEFRIGLTNADTGELGTYKVQVLDKNTIVKNWRTHYKLSGEEVAKLQSQDGIEFRVVMVGAQANVYLDDVQVCALDLSRNTEGKATDIADKAAQIGVRLYGSQGHRVDVAYALDDGQKSTTIQVAEGAQLLLNGTKHLIGETIVLKPMDAGCEFVTVKVDGKEVQLTDKESYSFTATAEKHTVDAVSRRVRDWNPNENKGHGWDLTQQTDGIVTVPAEVTDTDWMWTYEDSYRDISLTVADKTPAANDFRAAVHFAFTNGEAFRISLTNADSGALGTYKLQLMGSNTIVKNWSTPYTLSQAQIAKLQSGDGIAFRVAIVDAQAIVYLDNVQVCAIDLSRNTDGELTYVADMTAKIAVRMYGNSGKEAKAAYTLGGEPETVTVEVAEDAQLLLNGTTHIMGETIVLKPMDGGCQFRSVYVDGKEVTLTDKESCSFTATAEKHTVDAVSRRVRDWNPDENQGHSWDLTQQTDGIVTVPASIADTGWMWTYDDSYRDICLTVRDATPAANDFRAAVHFAFTNGEAFRVSLTNADSGALGTYKLQMMGSNTIVKNWSTPYTLSQAQITKLQSGDGIAFRVAIVGSSANIYLDGVQVCSLDLSKDTGGEPTDIAQKTAKLAVRMYGSNEKKADVAYELGGEPETVHVKVAQSDYGTLQLTGTSHIMGEKILLTPAPEDAGCQLVSLKLDGQEVTLTDGCYAFTAEKAEYTAEALFRRVHDWNPKENAGHTWDITQQTAGIITGSAGADTGWMWTYDDSYRDISLTVTDATPDANDFRAAVHFAFTNGEAFRISLTNADSGALGTYKVQLMGSNTIVKNWGTLYTLSKAQITALQSQDGIAFRVAIAGSSANVYLDGVRVCAVDLSKDTGAAPTDIADKTAKLAVRMYGSDGHALPVAYKLGGEPEAVSVRIPQLANGTVTADQDSYILGERVSLSVAGDSGYYYSGLQVNGEAVTVKADGTYSFIAEQKAYDVTGSFAEGIFMDFKNNPWNLINQNVGMLHIGAGSNGAGWMQTKGNYNELSLTVKDFAGGTVHEYAAVGQLYFSNGKYVSIRLIYFKDTDKYVLQSMGDSVFNWATHYTLDEAQKARVRGDGIVFRMTRTDTTLQLYLDDVLVKTLDLTGRNSGITADMTCVAKVRYYNNGGYDVTLPFVLGKPE